MSPSAKWDDVYFIDFFWLLDQKKKSCKSLTGESSTQHDLKNSEFPSWHAISFYLPHISPIYKFNSIKKNHSVQH